MTVKVTKEMLADSVRLAAADTLSEMAAEIDCERKQSPKNTFERYQDWQDQMMAATLRATADLVRGLVRFQKEAP